MKKILIYLILGLLVIQVIRPNKNKGEVSSDLQINQVLDVPDEINAIFERSCNDCHSNNTNYLWYHEIAPMSWMVAHHIKEGKEHLNFDEFANYNERQRAHAIEEIVETVKFGEMPLKGYTALHPEANLSQVDIELIEEWGLQFD